MSRKTSYNSRQERNNRTPWEQNPNVPDPLLIRDGPRQRNQRETNNARPNQRVMPNRQRAVRFELNQIGMVPETRQNTLEIIQGATSQLDQSQTKENPSKGL